MTEDEAREWLRARFDVSRETRLATFLELLRVESERQNLISASTTGSIWVRHVVDSAQLLALAPEQGGWLDIGTGAGFPGLVIAALRDEPVTLVEPRKRRAQFLEEAAAAIGLSNVTVRASRIETVKLPRPAAIISARAVAYLTELLSSARHCADAGTLWLLPKGRNAQSEVDAARMSWQGRFHVEPSLTDPESGIVIARGVASR